MRTPTFLGVLNSDVFSVFLKRFIKHNQDVEINDLRTMPMVVPTAAQAKRLETLAKTAAELKHREFASQQPSNGEAVFVRTLSAGLLADAPAYLRPGAQMQLLATVEDYLAVVELAVNWEAEKLYGVEGFGPFDEF
jgi:hypothetical protein